MGPTVATVETMATAPVCMGCLPSLLHFFTPHQCLLGHFPALESLALLLGTHTKTVCVGVCACVCVCLCCVCTRMLACCQGWVEVGSC